MNRKQRMKNRDTFRRLRAYLANRGLIDRFRWIQKVFGK